MQKIICLVGEPASGKGAVVLMMKEYGFSVLSLSDEVIKYTKGLGYENIPRWQISAIANEARQQRGPDCFAHPVVKDPAFQNAPLLVIDSIRNTTEIALIKGKASPKAEIEIWALQADPKLRFERTTCRKYSWDPKTFDEFMTSDQKELGLNGELCSQQNAACIAMAEVHIWNNGTLEELREQVVVRLETHSRIERPNPHHGKER